MCDDAVADISADPPPVCFQCVQLLAEITRLKRAMLKLLACAGLRCACDDCAQSVVLVWDRSTSVRRLFNLDGSLHDCGRADILSAPDFVKRDSEAAPADQVSP